MSNETWTAIGTMGAFVLLALIPILNSFVRQAARLASCEMNVKFAEQKMEFLKQNLDHDMASVRRHVAIAQKDGEDTAAQLGVLQREILERLTRIETQLDNKPKARNPHEA